MTITSRLVKSLITIFLCSKTSLCFSFSYDQPLQENLPLPSFSSMKPSLDLDDDFLDDSLKTVIPALPTPSFLRPSLTDQDIYDWSLRITGPSSIKPDISSFNIPALKKPYILECLQLCDRLEAKINKAANSDAILRITRCDNEMYGDLLKKIEAGYFDYNKEDSFLGLEEGKIDEFAKNMKELKEKKALLSSIPTPSEIYEEVQSVFDSACFNSPIRSGESSFIMPHGSTPPPKLTPRRRDNLKKLWNGRMPRTICLNLAQELALEDLQNHHHLAQEDQDMVLMIPERLHKKHHSSLHINPNGRGAPSQENDILSAQLDTSIEISIKKPPRPSKINRTLFAKNKSRAHKLHSVRMVRKRILNYCQFHSENHEKTSEGLTKS